MCVCGPSYGACKAHASYYSVVCGVSGCRLRLKCDGTRTETRFLLSAKRTCLFKSAGHQFSRLLASRGVRISGSNAGYTMFRGSVKNTGYLLHSPVSRSLNLLCVTVCHHISTGLYHIIPYYIAHSTIFGEEVL